MSHFAYIRPSGLWFGGVPVLRGEFQLLDQHQFKSINGDDGGAWAPASVITLGGAGLTSRFVGGSTVDGFSSSLTLINGATLDQHADSFALYRGFVEFLPGSTLAVYASTQFLNGSNTTFLSGSSTTFAASSTLNLAGETVVTGTFRAHGASYFGPEGNLFVSCITVLSGTVGISGPGLAVASPAVFGGTVSLNSAVTMHVGGTLQGPLVPQGAGRVPKRVKFFASTGSDGIFGPALYDRVYVAALTANVAFTIDDTGAVDGDEMVFVNNSFSFHITLQTPYGAAMATLILAKGQARAVTVTRMGGNWQVLLQEIF